MDALVAVSVTDDGIYDPWLAEGEVYPPPVPEEEPESEEAADNP